MCHTYGIKDPEEFVEQWMAFTLSRSGAPEPTTEALGEMERKEFSSNAAHHHQTTETKMQHQQPFVATIGAKLLGSGHYLGGIDNNDDVLMDSYIGNTTPKVSEIRT